jgi:hypothetical protein
MAVVSAAISAVCIVKRFSVFRGVATIIPLLEVFFNFPLFLHDYFMKFY